MTSGVWMMFFSCGCVFRGLSASAQHTCASPVDVFGFSYSAAQAALGDTKGRAIGYSGHTWGLDVLVFRLMHLAGYVNICATDPRVSL